MFDLYQLEQLLMIAERGTLSGAAEQQHLSQSALSRSMQRLEREIGVPLFLRRKNRIELNENGRLAVEYAKKILDQTHDMVAGIRSFDRQQRTISIGSCAPAPLWTLLPELADQYPEMTIASEMRDQDVLIQGLLDDTYQMIILPCLQEIGQVESRKYCEEHLFFSLPPAHPLCGSSGLHFADLVFIVLAMCAVGLNTNIVKLIKTGGKPLALGFCCWIGIASMSLLMQHVLGIW